MRHIRIYWRFILALLGTRMIELAMAILKGAGVFHIEASKDGVELHRMTRKCRLSVAENGSSTDPRYMGVKGFYRTTYNLLGGATIVLWDLSPFQKLGEG